MEHAKGMGHRLFKEETTCVIMLSDAANDLLTFSMGEEEESVAAAMLLLWFPKRPTAPPVQAPINKCVRVCGGGAELTKGTHTRISALCNIHTWHRQL